MSHLLATVNAALAGQESRAAELRNGYVPKVLLVGCDLAWSAVVGALLREGVRITTLEVARGAAILTADADLVVTDIHGATVNRSALVPRIAQALPAATVFVVNATGSASDRTPRNVVPLPYPTRFGHLLCAIRQSLARWNGGIRHTDGRVAAIFEAAVADFPSSRFAELGAELHASPYYLSRLFRAEIGMPLKTFLNRVQVEAARQLLVETDEKLEAIAPRVGLHDASHPSRLFLKYTGRRPGELRRKGE